ncbi:MAG: hypothetical protein AAF437_14870 [Pseudomonadota bacterium]
MKKTGKECFVATDGEPPKRRMWITSIDLVSESAPIHHRSGWEIVIDQMDSDGKWQPFWDTWAETYSEALRYPKNYLSNTVVWTEESTGKPVDIYALELEE